MSFDSPFDLQDAVLVCLASAFTVEEWEALRFHTGSAGTGSAIPCCPAGLLRVETGPMIPNDDLGRRWLARPNGCITMQQIILVTYRRCYTSQTKQGTKRKDEEITAQGRSLEASGWAAVLAMACCPDYLIRFGGLTYDEPESCAGWTMTLDGDVKVCAAACTPEIPSVQPPMTTPPHPSMTVAIGVAGESSAT